MASEHADSSNPNEPALPGDPTPSPREVTMLLGEVNAGEPRAADRLLVMVYEELRKLAHARMRNEPSNHTLQATSLVHEAYIRPLGDEQAKWQSRGHFFGAAALAMRRILVERARRVAGPKRGGGRQRMDADEIDLTADTANDTDLIALDESLKKLEVQDPRMAQIVMLRFFAGLSVEDTASALDISPRTVKREWAVARAWLYQHMTGEEDENAQ
ncbi:MAG: sigma-70 family RNA polymerase sigma factor [Phycisphaerales bacterium]